MWVEICIVFYLLSKDNWIKPRMFYSQLWFLVAFDQIYTYFIPLIKDDMTLIQNPKYKT